VYVQKALFSNVLLENIRDLYTRNETEWERQEDLKAVVRFLQSSYTYVAQVFKFYAAGNTAEAASASTMDFDEYCSLVRDIAITTTAPKVSKKDVMADFDRVFHDQQRRPPPQPTAPSQVKTETKAAAANKSKPPAKSAIADRPRRQSVMGAKKSLEVVVLETDDDRELGPPEFVELLVRLGNRRFAKDEALTTVASRLEEFIHQDVQAKAARVDSDPFRKLLRDPLVDRVYRKHRRPLERIFAFYGGQDGGMSINVEEFSLMLKQVGIMPQYLDQDEVAQLFQCIQKEEIGEEEGAAEMDYTEFLEAIAAITTFTIPNPYMGLDQRLELFISETLLVKAKQVKKLPPKFGHATVAAPEQASGAGEEVELAFDKIVDETSERDKTLKVRGLG